MSTVYSQTLTISRRSDQMLMVSITQFFQKRWRLGGSLGESLHYFLSLTTVHSTFYSDAQISELSGSLKLRSTVSRKHAPFDLKCSQKRLRLGLSPRPSWGSLRRSPRPPNRGARVPSAPSFVPLAPNLGPTKL
jgi:hypothetical protein